MDQALKLLPKIVQHMKSRHIENKTKLEPISLDDILEEINSIDTSTKVKAILENEILINNEKIEVVEVKGEDSGGIVKKYNFKPPLELRKRKDLIELLKRYQTEGKGGLLREEVKESLPDADTIIDKINKISDKTNVEIKILGKGKKEVLFYNERNPVDQLKIDQEIVEHWRKVQIEGMDENKLEDYLEKNKIASMKGRYESGDAGGGSTKPKVRKSRQFKKHNEHVAHLDDYDPELIAKPRTKKQ